MRAPTFLAWLACLIFLATTGNAAAKPFKLPTRRGPLTATEVTAAVDHLERTIVREYRRAAEEVLAGRPAPSGFLALEISPGFRIIKAADLSKLDSYRDPKELINFAEINNGMVDVQVTIDRQERGQRTPNKFTVRFNDPARKDFWPYLDQTLNIDEDGPELTRFYPAPLGWPKGPTEPVPYRE